MNKGKSHRNSATRRNVLKKGVGAISGIGALGAVTAGRVSGSSRRTVKIHTNSGKFRYKVVINSDEVDKGNAEGANINRDGYRTQITGTIDGYNDTDYFYFEGDILKLRTEAAGSGRHGALSYSLSDDFQYTSRDRISVRGIVDSQTYYGVRMRNNISKTDSCEPCNAGGDCVDGNKAEGYTYGAEDVYKTSGMIEAFTTSPDGDDVVLLNHY